MKIRNGFVSNSSSSSYIVVIPDGFKPKKDDQITKILWDILLRNKCLNNQYMWDEIQAESDKETDKIQKAFNDLLYKELEPYVVSDIGTGPDDGTGIILIDNKKIRKIWGIIKYEMGVIIK